MKHRPILFLLAVILLVSSCQRPANPMIVPPDSSPAVPPPAAIRYLALGDSYTIGESVPEAERWPVQLAALLREQKINVAPPSILARTGWTTAELADAIGKSGDTNRYGLVSLLIGVNNQYRGQSLDRYRTELRGLLKTAAGFAGGNRTRVFVLSIPDWGVSPFARGRDRTKIATEIDAFNAVCKEECAGMGIAYHDITPLSRTAATDPSLIATDDLHFSGKMYGLWAAQVLPGVEALLK